MKMKKIMMIAAFLGIIVTETNAKVITVCSDNYWTKCTAASDPNPKYNPKTDNPSIPVLGDILKIGHKNSLLPAGMYRATDNPSDSKNRNKKCDYAGGRAYHFPMVFFTFGEAHPDVPKWIVVCK